MEEMYWPIETLLPQRAHSSTLVLQAERQLAFVLDSEKSMQITMINAWVLEIRITAGLNALAPPIHAFPFYPHLPCIWNTVAGLNAVALPIHAFLFLTTLVCTWNIVSQGLL